MAKKNKEDEQELTMEVSEDHVYEPKETETLLVNSSESLTSSLKVDPSEPDATYSPREIEDSRKFLNKYGIDTEELSDWEVVYKINKIKSHTTVAAQVLSRGQVSDGLEKLLELIPAGHVGAFKTDSEMNIQRAEAMGWKVYENESAKKLSSTPTGTADNRIRLGDQILMYMPEEKHVALRLAKAMRLRRRQEAKPATQGMIKESANSPHPLFPI